ncbi:type II toxin-antitoxin system VapC family toxin [Lichenicoccus sp.]|uniref:type II toxin-antitoxin system VapC family toxin n=1 Tax=Lichenicoccus sp. TaxID=2781899 RepID=UPI003D0DF6C5
MVIDSSAFVAIVIGEPEREAFSRAILSQATRLVSTATLLETTMVVLGRKGEPGVAEFNAFIDHTGIETAPFTAEHLDFAIDAFRRFGKGRHPAGLNFGDCISYALAKATGEPLLFKGDDFSRTDIRRAV